MKILKILVDWIKPENKFEKLSFIDAKEMRSRTKRSLEKGNYDEITKELIEKIKQRILESSEQGNYELYFDECFHISVNKNIVVNYFENLGYRISMTKAVNKEHDLVDRMIIC